MRADQLVGEKAIGAGLTMLLATLAVCCILFTPENADANPPLVDASVVGESEFIAEGVGVSCVCKIKCTCASNWCCDKAQGTGKFASRKGMSAKALKQWKKKAAAKQKTDDDAQLKAAEAKNQQLKDEVAKLKTTQASASGKENSNAPKAAAAKAGQEAASKASKDLSASKNELEQHKKAEEELKKKLAAATAQQKPSAADDDKIKALKAAEEKLKKKLSEATAQQKTYAADGAKIKDLKAQLQQQAAKDQKQLMAEKQKSTQASKDAVSQANKKIGELQSHLHDLEQKTVQEAAKAKSLDAKAKSLDRAKTRLVESAKKMADSLHKQSETAHLGALHAVKAAKAFAAEVATNSSATTDDISQAQEAIVKAHQAFATAKLAEAEAHGAHTMQKAIMAMGGAGGGKPKR